MVIISDVSEMFWGLILDEGKRYSQIVESSFHISMAAIQPKAGSKDIASVYIEHNGQEYLLCSLQQGALIQQALDLGFLAGESLTLFTTGKSTVHMTGYRVLDDEGMGELSDVEESDLSDMSSDEEDVEPPTKKSKKAHAQAKKPALDEVDEFDESDEDSDSSDDSYLNGPASRPLKYVKSFGSDDDSSVEEEDNPNYHSSDEEMSEGEMEEVAEEIRQEKIMKEKKKLQLKASGLNGKQSPKTPDNKLQKKQAKTPQQKTKTPQQQAKSPQQQAKSPQQQAMSPQQQAKTPQQKTKTPQQQAKTPQQQAKTPQQKQAKTPQEGKKEPVKTPQQKQESKTPVKRKLPSGVIIEDLKEGHGPEAKNNKMVHVYYTGKLTSGKVFDSSTSGRPFKFRLGKSEVIKGWEIGVQGMKVGGKRRLTIPPNLAYGNDRSGGLPPNSTLLFDIELKATT